MHHFYNVSPQPAHPYKPPQVPYYPTPAPGAAVVLHDRPSHFDQTIIKRYDDSEKRLLNALSSQLPDPNAKRDCEYFLRRLRIDRHLFMHTYVHLVSCCNGSNLRVLMTKADVWTRWNSVQQLARHSSIRDELMRLGMSYPCGRHRTLFAQAISDDDSDVQCHLLYCRRKSELYDMSKNGGASYDAQSSDQIMELIWKLLKTCQDIQVEGRLCAQIYRMARKSGYLLRDLQIAPSLIQKEQPFGAGGSNGMLTKARMNGRDVIIKNIPCKDGDNKKKYLKTFAKEAIVWKTMNHKNIAPFLGVVMQGAFNVGLVSTFFRNGSVRYYIRRSHHQYWPGMATKLAKDLAEALAYIHRHEPPIIHGDLKGDNVLVDDNGHALLADFGQSHTEDSGKIFDSSRVGVAAENPICWMAPEIMTGGDKVKSTDKSDVYSFGCVLYEMISGQIPFGGKRSITHPNDYPMRPELIREDDPLWRIAKWCWKRCPEDRPNAARLVSELSWR